MDVSSNTTCICGFHQRREFQGRVPILPLFGNNLQVSDFFDIMGFQARV